MGALADDSQLRISTVIASPAMEEKLVNLILATRVKHPARPVHVAAANVLMMDRTDIGAFVKTDQLDNLASLPKIFVQVHRA